MRRPTILVLLLCAAPLALAGCGDDELPIAPTPIQPTVESINGTINPFSARIHAFSVQDAGTVTVTLVQIDPNDPDNPTTIGLDLGTSLGANICQVTISNTSTQLGESVLATATSAGTLCARVFDALPGGLPSAITYELEVTHF